MKRLFIIGLILTVPYANNAMWYNKKPAFQNKLEKHKKTLLKDVHNASELTLRNYVLTGITVFGMSAGVLNLYNLNK